MKAFNNAVPRDVAQAVTMLDAAKRANKRAFLAGGGSDLLGMVKEQLIAPDTVIRLAGIKGLDQVKTAGQGVSIGGQITLSALSRHQTIRDRYRVLAEAAETVATLQIRNVGTLAGNVCQRPWCWYYRNGFNCFKAGGNVCYSVAGENQFHAIFGGGPSFIVHPSDTAPALVALDATFHVAGPQGERAVAAADFFALPTANPARENVLKDDEVLASISLPASASTVKSTYQKVMDREAWTHAIVSVAAVLDLDGGVCRSARLVLGGVAPIPWRVPDAERLLTGQRITADLALAAGKAAVAGARPLQHNAYKVPMVEHLVVRTIADLVEVRG